ncbi:MAG: cytochrome c-type biogenesis protein CcmH [Hydrogenophaga sp.]|nr:cytochrome c-type biogenesis protein CcmH [Hydrogenophaga sp.]
MTTQHTVRCAITAACLALACTAAPAREATPLAADPALEARVMALADELRCLVCQNETIAASNAELAVDLRQQIRQQLTQGRSPEDILSYMTARYGDFVRYKPPLRAGTVLLWLGPFLLLLLGAVLLWRQLRQQHRTHTPAALSDAERQRAQQLLEGRS